MKLANFYAKLLHLTMQIKPHEFGPVKYAYGEAPNAKECIGSSVPQ